jgi:hypothetical protein
MSKLSSTNPFSFVGKPVEDEYGRQVGRIASFMINPDGQVSNVFIERGDGEFTHYSFNLFDVTDKSIVLLSSIKSRAKVLCEEIPLIWRKSQAINELMEKKRIPQEMFNDLHKNFENALNEMKANSQALLEEIDKLTIQCNLQVKEFQLASGYLDIEREIGRIDEKSYQIAFELIQERFKQVSIEKADLEVVKNKLSNLTLGESRLMGGIRTEPKKDAAPNLQASITLPEPPVVVTVKGTVNSVLAKS